MNISQELSPARVPAPGRILRRHGNLVKSNLRLAFTP